MQKGLLNIMKVLLNIMKKFLVLLNWAELEKNPHVQQKQDCKLYISCKTTPARTLTLWESRDRNAPLGNEIKVCAADEPKSS